MALEFARRIRDIPVYPAADGYALPDEVAMLASNESPYPPLPEVVEAVQRVLSGVNRYPDPTSATLRRRLSLWRALADPTRRSVLLSSRTSARQAATMGTVAS